MTARTHDLAAFTALLIAVVYLPVPTMSMATVLGAVLTNMLGGLAPDIDEGTAEFWQKFRGGSVIGKMIAPLLGGHRLISHSLVGVFLAAKFSEWIFMKLGSVVLVDMQILWLAFMIGYVSHLVMDALTKEGVPLLFPVPVHFGIPPIKALRITTGKLVEKTLVFPGLVLLNARIIYVNYPLLLELLRSLK